MIRLNVYKGKRQTDQHETMTTKKKTKRRCTHIKGKKQKLEQQSTLFWTFVRLKLYILIQYEIEQLKITQKKITKQYLQPHIT